MSSVESQREVHHPLRCQSEECSAEVDVVAARLFQIRVTERHVERIGIVADVEKRGEFRHTLRCGVSTFDIACTRGVVELVSQADRRIKEHGVALLLIVLIAEVTQVLALPLQRQACRERELWLCRTIAMGEVERSLRRLLCRMHSAAIAIAVVKGGKQGLTLRGQHAQGIVLLAIAFHLVDAVEIVACVVVALTNTI